jgi:hypothetical protein
VVRSVSQHSVLRAARRVELPFAEPHREFCPTRNFAAV